MDRSQDFIGSDRTVNRDLKRDVLERSSLNCVSDKIDNLDKTVEDTNCNLTLLKSQRNLMTGVDDKQTPTSSEKGKPNVIGVHVGPNGLLNGLEIDNSATLNQILEQIPDHEKQENLCTPSSSHITQKLCFETDTKSSRTEINTLSANSNNESLSASLSYNTLEKDKFDPDASKEQCRPIGELEQEPEVKYVSYLSEVQMPDIMRLIQKDLSEPYSIYTYRYFIHNWPKLCFLAMDESTCVGAIVCKLDTHRKVVKRGYIAMLAVDEKYRKKKIGSNLVLKAIRAMVADDADEVVLETEITNRPALRLYENLGFVRDKRLFRYYLNGVDALRLKLWLR